MAVTINPPQKLSQTTWKFTWSSDATPPVTYRIYRDGTLVLTTRARQTIVSIPSGTSPLYEIRDDDALPSAVFPRRIVLGWYAASGAVRYRVDELVEADPDVWSPLATIDDEGRGHFNWESEQIEDGVNPFYRVVPIDDAGNDGTVVVLNARVIGHPSPPDVTFSYDKPSGKVTIALVA